MQCIAGLIFCRVVLSVLCSEVMKINEAICQGYLSVCLMPPGVVVCGDKS
jgi:hypothetical protein